MTTLHGLPVLVVGDVHGDIERLFAALKRYPASDWHTVFLGDLVDGGMFGVGALRYARDRAHSTVLLGNHEALMLAALRDPARRTFWFGVGGQAHDLRELESDPGLQEWLRSRPATVQLDDGTICQHADNDGYRDVDWEAALRDGREADIWDAITRRRVFADNRPKLERWLGDNHASRVVHGHTPHQNWRPLVYHDGLAVNFDGQLGRYGGVYRRRRESPTGASVAPLGIQGEWQG